MRETRKMETLSRISWVIMLISCAHFLGGAPLSAQFAGRWALELGPTEAAPSNPAAATGGPGRFRAVGPTEGLLEITVDGDSASGTWTTGGGGQGSLELVGSVADGRLILRGTRQMLVRLNGETSRPVVVVEVDLTESSGELSGTLRTRAAPEGRVLSSSPVNGRPAG